MLWPVLACSGCYNRLPQTEGLINNRYLYLTVLEAGKSKIKVSADLVSGESLLSGSEMAIFLLCPHLADGVKGALWGLSY